MKVRITSHKIPKRIGAVGDVVEVPNRYARAWIKRGFAEDPGEDMEVGEGMEDLTVAELKERAGDMEVERADGKDGDPLKADYIRALSGTYNRRDLRAEA